MKTLKKDGINEKLLIETLAYIESHEALWDQDTWRQTQINGRCKTPMCFAGHAVITLTGAQDVMPLPPLKDLKAVRANKATLAQHERVADWEETQESVKPTRKEISDGKFHTVTLTSGDEVKVVNISSRATWLLGHEAVSGGYTGNLFAGSNSLEDIRYHIADKLDYTLSELEQKVRRAARENHWRIPASVTY